MLLPFCLTCRYLNGEPVFARNGLTGALALSRTRCAVCAVLPLFRSLSSDARAETIVARVASTTFISGAGLLEAVAFDRRAAVESLDSQNAYHFRRMAKRKRERETRRMATRVRLDKNQKKNKKKSESRCAVSLSMLSQLTPAELSNICCRFNLCRWCRRDIPRGGGIRREPRKFGSTGGCPGQRRASDATE